MHTHGSPPHFRGGIHLFIYTAIRHLVSPEFIGSRNCVPIAFTAESPPARSVVLKVVPVTDAVLAGYHGPIDVCVYVVIPFILDARLVDVPAGVTQEEGDTGFLHLPSALLALIFLARRIQPFLSLFDGELIVLHLLGILFYFIFIMRKNPSSRDCTEIQTHVPTSEGFEVTN